MSPDARLIAAATLLGHALHSDSIGARKPSEIAQDVLDLETALGDSAKDAPGIRGMVPVAYLKDILVGVISRLEAANPMITQEMVSSHTEALNYARRRRADVEGL